jgi:hypothetical protein
MRQMRRSSTPTFSPMPREKRRKRCASRIDAMSSRWRRRSRQTFWDVREFSWRISSTSSRGRTTSTSGSWKPSAAHARRSRTMATASVFLNRFDRDDPTHVANVEWLERRDQLPVLTNVAHL